MGLFAAIWFCALLVLEWVPKPSPTSTAISGSLLILFLLVTLGLLVPMIRAQPRCFDCGRHYRGWRKSPGHCPHCNAIVVQVSVRTPQFRRRHESYCLLKLMRVWAWWYCIVLLVCGAGAAWLSTCQMFGIFAIMFGIPFWGMVWLRMRRAMFAVPFAMAVVGGAIAGYLLYLDWP